MIFKLFDGFNFTKKSCFQEKKSKNHVPYIILLVYCDHYIDMHMDIVHI